MVMVVRVVSAVGGARDTARRALSSLGTRIAQLMVHTEPSEQLAVAARYAQRHDNVVGVHLFSFGGVVRTARWVHERMSASTAAAAPGRISAEATAPAG